MSTFIERKQRRRDTSGLLLLLELSAPSMPEVLRLANDTKNWTSNGLLYYGAPFKFTGPEDSSGSTPRAVIKIDNVGRGMSDDLESLSPNEIITAELKITDFYNPDAIIKTLYLPMTQVTVNPASVQGQCGVDYIMRQRAVKYIATPHRTPGIF